jgi:hypothetical protein
MTFGTCQRLQLRVMSTAMEPGSAKTFIAARKLSFKPELRAWSVFADLGSLNANTPVGSPPASTTAARGPLSPIRRRPQDQFRVAGSTMLDVFCTVLDTSSNVSVNWFDGTSWEGKISTERGYLALTFGGHPLLPKGSIEFVGPLPTYVHRLDCFVGQRAIDDRRPANRSALFSLRRYSLVEYNRSGTITAPLCSVHSSRRSLSESETNRSTCGINGIECEVFLRFPGLKT